MVIISVSWRLLRVCSVFGGKWARMWMCVFLPRQWMRARAVIVLVMRWTDLLGLVVSCSTKIEPKLYRNGTVFKYTLNNRSTG